ncbi:MAG TPA: hypothetical protein VN698_16175 [Bacteroidia bacterium]|nr:hypothetical protein [Bacteroidia bacterium]
MLGAIETIEQSEYNNPLALLGLGDAEMSNDFLGALRKLPITRQVAVMNQVTAPVMPSKGSRGEMEKHFRHLPAHIKAQLANGSLRLADTLIYSIKPINASKTIKMFETQDERQVGLRNISNGRLQKNQALLVSGVVLLAGVAGDATPDGAMALNFGKLEDFPALANGESDLKANKKVIFPETSNNVFKTNGFNAVPLGYYKLHNPRLIEDDVLIEFTVNLGSVTGLLPNTYLFLGLHGTITTP